MLTPYGVHCKLSLNLCGCFAVYLFPSSSLGCQGLKVFLARIFWDYIPVTSWWASQEISPLCKMPFLFLCFQSWKCQVFGPLLPFFSIWHTTSHGMSCHFCQSLNPVDCNRLMAALGSWLWLIVHLLRCREVLWGLSSSSVYFLRRSPSGPNSSFICFCHLTHFWPYFTRKLGLGKIIIR